MKHHAEPETAVERAIQLLVRMARDGSGACLKDQAAQLDIPLSTAYRMVATFRRHGLLARQGPGHFGAGLTLAMLARSADLRAILVNAARRPLRDLARSMRATAHLGVLDGEMVTYLVKEFGGGDPLFTREGGQLEAYCSAIGKNLLAALPEDRLQSYLESAPFVALTDRTVTDPADIRAELHYVARSRYAVDDREVADDLVCVSVPVRDREGGTVAAISLARRGEAVADTRPPQQLLACAAEIERRLGTGE